MNIVGKINTFLGLFDVVVRRKSKMEQEIKNVCSHSSDIPEYLRPTLHILLHQQNLYNTMVSGKPIAPDGSPIPWYTFPATEYFNTLDVSGLKIFEYSSGHSSLYWARKGAKIWSVEDNPDWHDYMKSRSADMQGIFLRANESSYIDSIAEPGEHYDIIIVDGQWRAKCTEKALEFLNPNGVIILDNSDWWKDAGFFLQQQGFFEVSFSGFGPVNAFCWTTSLFLPGCEHVLSQRASRPLPVGGIQVSKHEKW